VNLASPETLESISSLLDPFAPSFTLIESGSLEPIVRHPNFRLFACMNPSTDVGKRDIPPSIRARFTEIFVDPPDTHKATLVEIIKGYVGGYALHDASVILDVAEYYLAAKELSENRRIADGSNRRPHFSVRTLTRALSFARDCSSSFGLRRSLWEGCALAFTMSLDPPSTELMTTLARTHLLRNVRNLGTFFSQQFAISPGQEIDSFDKIGSYWIKRGSQPPGLAPEYILTPSVEAKISNLGRAIFYHRSPILIEGPTSSGKTSAIQYIAARTGHRFVRVNNHEHTDIQEYLGSYQSDPTTGQLRFTDGVLVRALRSGDWLVLDELNLAPTEVLEALNRLLDDNRELVIPETQEVITPHPDFLLFATQNPHGSYGGRKALSRAFRNRFLEFYFEDVPQTELETIVGERCRIAPSYARKIVAVFRELQLRRQSTRVFESKESFATLRDVFRWGNRMAPNIQALAEDGFMLLGERTRSEEDKLVVQEVIESVLGVRLRNDIYAIVGKSDDVVREWLGCSIPSNHNLVWTTSAQRLFVLLSRALRFQEPVLLVGEPGSGKTSMCELYALAVQRTLVTLNCHQNTETADLIGGQRASRGNRQVTENGPAASQSASSSIFQWEDGPLVKSMKQGHPFLLDELSLADDAVLERLNSVLEPSRTLVLAENPTATGNETVVGSEGFQILATMNPGGDYGKKELSPALRNRFTEIWVPVIESRAELEPILDRLLHSSGRTQYVNPMLDFRAWLSSRTGNSAVVSLRDMLVGFAPFQALFAHVVRLGHCSSPQQQKSKALLHSSVSHRHLSASISRNL
jgi:midasin